MIAAVESFRDHSGQEHWRKLEEEDGMLMRRALELALLTTLLIGVAESLAEVDRTRPTAAADLELWRLDCGMFPNTNVDQLSDTFSYHGLIKNLTSSCYLIRHNRDYMLWDTGFTPQGAEALSHPGLKVIPGEPLKVQLSRIGVDPERISIVGLSHFHPDHTGQASQFPQARLIMGKLDFDILVQSKSADITPWLKEGANVQSASGDVDVFGDGNVVMLFSPGHTMGHFSLLVRLRRTGPVILSGDLWHISENVSRNGVPAENMDRAATLASMDRILKISHVLKARIIVQHEKADISKLPLFPGSAR